MRDAFGRGGWFWEGISDASAGIGKLLIKLVVILIAAFLAKWAYTEWFVSTHCTMVLGTRVCR